MELVAALGRSMGFSFAAGINLYATIAFLGIASRFELFAFPESLQMFDSDLVIGVSLVLYLVEFTADKIPLVDSMWDSVHIFIRPVGGAIIAVISLGEAAPMVEGLVALLGGLVATGSHLTKASARVAVNTSPEPVSNWILSLGGDVLIVGLGYFALVYPVASLVAVAVAVGAIGLFFATIVRLSWTSFVGGRSK